MATIILNIDEELNEEQTAEWAKRVNTATDQFLADVEPKQFYYVKSPLAPFDVLNRYIRDGQVYFGFNGPLESGGYETRFTKSQLKEFQKDLFGLDLEALKVRVEDYDNE